MEEKKMNKVKLLPGFFDRGNPIPTFEMNGITFRILRPEFLDEDINPFIYSGYTQNNESLEITETDQEDDLEFDLPF